MILIPLMPNEGMAITMLFLKYSISEMDVPTRNAYTQQVVDPDERTAASGLTNVIRSLGKSMGPLLAGFLYANPKYSNYPFFIAGGLKIVYDLLLLKNFSSLKPASEQTGESMLSEKNEENIPLLDFPDNEVSKSTFKVRI